MNKQKLLTAHCSLLTDKKSLLAFSAGIDSSALFFMLVECGVEFDIAIVDYGLREQSAQEVAHAKELASKYGKECYVAQAPRFESHFECQARKFRYGFFELIIKEHGYNVLLTAHQLNDRLEWMLMRLGKGAGLSELIGMEEIERRDGYDIVRPLLGYTKSELLSYLKQHNYPYFVDESNQDTKYERNYIRHNFADKLIEKYGDGIARSFEYLSKDKDILESGYSTLRQEKELVVIHLDNPDLKTRAADQTLKRLGYLLSAAQREEIAQNDSVAVGGKWAVELSGEKLYIAPYIKTIMPKEFKEKCRIEKIPPKVRGYIYGEQIAVSRQQ